MSMLTPYVPVGIKETKKQKNKLMLTGSKYTRRPLQLVRRGAPLFLMTPLHLDFMKAINVFFAAYHSWT